MTSPPGTPDGTLFGRLTPSTRTALGWAGVRAETREDAGGPGEKGGGSRAQRNVDVGEALMPMESLRPRVLVPDLVVGILLSHGEGSEPAQLLRWAGVSPARLEAMLTPSGFLPSQAKGDPEGWMKRFQGEYEGRTDALAALASPGALQALNVAGEMAASLNPEGSMIRLRDLFGGVLLGSEEGQGMFASLLEGSALDMQTLASVYPAFLALDSSRRLEAFLDEQFPETAGDTPAPQDEEAPASVLRVAVPDPDRTGSEDLVGIGPEVDAFAYLMTAPALRPPLAVGLFGDWGSGKSFFMESLRRKIDDLTDAARQAEGPQAGIPVFRHVAQIEFNAWHYVEGNLWASLVEHIFQTLAGVDDPDDPDVVKAKIAAWSMELDSQKVARSQVRSRLATLEAERREREEALRRSVEERRAKLQELKRAQISDAMAAVTMDEEVRAEIARLLDRVGLNRLNASAVETRGALDDARALLQRGNALLTPLRTRGREGWSWALLLVGVALAGPLVSWGLARIPDQPLDAVTRTLTGIATFLSFLTVSLRRGSQWMSTALQEVESAQGRLEELRARKAAEMAGEEAALQHELEELDREVARLAGRKAEIDRRIEAIEAEMRSLTPARLISNFIEERVGSEDYRKHLGVPALIRRDFRRLSRLVETQNQALMRGDDAGIEGTSGSTLVNRVILYIDDLDRCPPERVVEVLQAVHLLLAFELFVVVVAVDSRWLSRSLLSHYQNLLNGEVAAGGPAGGATPDDYLEKIFQIPFHVRPLTDDARTRILQGLLGPHPSGEGTGNGAQGVPGTDLQVGGSGGGTDPSGGLPAGAPGGGEDGGTPGAGSGDVPVVSFEDRDGSASRSPDAAPPPTPAPGPDLSPGRLQITPEELAFMEALRPLLGRTPRSVKRFVNVYRLLTSIAGARGIPLQADEEIPPFQVAMFLLAVVTGLPGMAPEILAWVERGARAARTGQREEEQMTLEWVMGQYTAGALHYRPEGPSPEYRALRGWLDSHADGGWKELPLARVAPWIDPVSRFTFHPDVGVRG